MSSDRPPHGQGDDSENILALLRQIDAELQQRRQDDDGRVGPVRPREVRQAPAGSPGGEASSLSPSALAEIMARLDSLDSQVRQMQTKVQLEHLEAQLRQVHQLVQSGLQGNTAATAENGDSTNPFLGRQPAPGESNSGWGSDGPQRRDPRFVRLPSTLLPDTDAASLDASKGFGPTLLPNGQTIGRTERLESPLMTGPSLAGAVVTPAGDSATLTAPEAVPELPSWSPDERDDEAEGGGWGRRLLILAIAIAALLLVVAALVLAPRLLNRPGPGPTPPSKTAPAAIGSGRIVFQSDRETPNQPQLFTMNVDGTNPSRMPISVPYAWNPRFSPDGQRIAFVGDVGGVSDIYIVNADGSNLKRVTSNARNNRHATWSPDGQWLAFGSDRTGNWDVYVARADGSDLRNLTNAPSDDNLPAWSPDGQRIAFQSDRAGPNGRMQIWTIDVAGGRPLNLSNSNASDSFPQWSPNGDLLSFYSERDGNREIYIMNADGGEQRNLTNHPAKDELAVWSTDGRWLVFASDRDGNMDLYSLRLDSGEVRRLTDNPGHDWAPSWGR